MLGTLLDKAGEDTTVILMSDHGFHPDHLRPASIPDIPAGPAIEHRDFGILAISGPGIKKDELLHGASVLDIAPTILTMYGLPSGEDMDGKVLSQAFAESAAGRFIPSWEEVAGADGRHPPHTRLDPVAAHEALEQMIALGYIERPDENREMAVEKTIRELRYNLGEAYQDDDRHRKRTGFSASCMPPIPMSSASRCGCSSPARPWGCTRRCGALLTTWTVGAARCLKRRGRRSTIATKAGREPPRTQPNALPTSGASWPAGEIWRATIRR